MSILHPWIVIDGNTKPPFMLCERCGDREALGVPVSVTFLCKVMTLFANDHRKCKEERTEA
jgi:hypothetical protein